MLLHTEIAKALIGNLAFATVIAVIGFALIWNAFARLEGLWTAVFAVLGLLFGYWAIDWNLQPGRLADAARIYDVESWQTIAVTWPAFLWTVLFLICTWARAGQELKATARTELQDQ